jgi:anti-anti-sigma regulatory factor
MLRLRTHSSPGETLLVVEGRLAGPWVEELAQYWTKLRDEKHAEPIRVDLDAVTFVSVAGKALLARIHDDGAILSARACMTNAIIEEIVQSAAGKTADHE